MNLEEILQKLDKLEECMHQIRKSFIRLGTPVLKTKIGKQEFSYNLKTAHKTALEAQCTAKIEEFRKLISELPKLV